MLAAAHQIIGWSAVWGGECCVCVHWEFWGLWGGQKRLQWVGVGVESWAVVGGYNLKETLL